MREISSCSCFTVLLGPARVLLSKTYKPLFPPLTTFGSYGPNRWLLLHGVPFRTSFLHERGDFFIIRVAAFVCGGKICILSESKGAMGVRERARLQSVEYEFAMGVGDDAEAFLPRRKYAPEIRFWASQGGVCEETSASHFIPWK